MAKKSGDAEGWSDRRNRSEKPGTYGFTSADKSAEVALFPSLSILLKT